MLGARGARARACAAARRTAGASEVAEAKMSCRGRPSLKLSSSCTGQRTRGGWWEGRGKGTGREGKGRGGSSAGLARVLQVGLSKGLVVECEESSS